MPYSKLDLSESVSFVIAAISFVVVAYLYFLKKDGKKSAQKKYIGLKLLFLIFFLIFLNRMFTNIEALAYKNVFNFLEHTSSALAGGIALWFSLKKKVVQIGSNS